MFELKIKKGKCYIIIDDENRFGLTFRRKYINDYIIIKDIMLIDNTTNHFKKRFIEFVKHNNSGQKRKGRTR